MASRHLVIDPFTAQLRGSTQFKTALRDQCAFLQGHSTDGYIYPAFNCLRDGWWSNGKCHNVGFGADTAALMHTLRSTGLFTETVPFQYHLDSDGKKARNGKATGFRIDWAKLNAVVIDPALDATWTPRKARTQATVTKRASVTRQPERIANQMARELWAIDNTNLTTLDPLIVQQIKDGRCSEGSNVEDHRIYSPMTRLAKDKRERLTIQGNAIGTLDIRSAHPQAVLFSIAYAPGRVTKVKREAHAFLTALTSGDLYTALPSYSRVDIKNVVYRLLNDPKALYLEHAPVLQLIQKEIQQRYPLVYKLVRSRPWRKSKRAMDLGTTLENQMQDVVDELEASCNTKFFQVFDGKIFDVQCYDAIKEHLHTRMPHLTFTMTRDGIQEIILGTYPEPSSQCVITTLPTYTNSSGESTEDEPPDIPNDGPDAAKPTTTDEITEATTPQMVLDRLTMLTLGIM